jgi:tetratricopeptide (TPR) repeat protein
MQLRVLGAVEVYAGGRVCAFSRPQQGLVLAALIAELGRPVPTEILVDRVWGEAPPQHARRLLHTHVARLRKLLERASALDNELVSVTRRGRAYLLDVPPDSVDLHRFRDLVARAGAVGCPARRRACLLREALDLWRGEPLAGLSGHWVERTRHVWAQQRLHAVLEWARAELDHGDHVAALPRLAELVAEHPLVEPLAAVYMRALYAVGRPAEALNHHTTIRRLLADELGTDPSPELQQLHRQILSADPGLDPPTTATRSGSPLVPRQLPAPPQLFTGRVRELARLDQVHDVPTVVITAIDGMAGIGKTALAVHAAHRIADRYPNGQLFIDLHGYTLGVDPVEPGEALEYLLRGLGVPGPQIPAGLDQRAALYRTRLADQRMLIVLDNAATEAQVVPLLPGSAGCLVLVTSRRRLGGLDHTHTLSLDTLPVADAVELFTRTSGEDQPAERSAELVELCGLLPLAIRIAAARLRAHPSWDLSHLVARLRDRQRRLGELAAGQRSVTAALDLSYRDLNPDLRRTYRLLGLHPGPEIDGYATAALLDVTVADAGRLLDQLHDAHLLQEPAPGRYRFHDLTRAHAAYTAGQVDAASRVSLDRLLDYYRHTAAAAMDAAYLYEREHRPQVPPARTPAPELPDRAGALAWLDTELPNLLAAARYATEYDRPEHVLHVSSLLHRDLATRGRYHDAETLHHQALLTARAIGHQAAELDALANLGAVHRLQGRYEQATDHLRRASQVARLIGHQVGELHALTGLGHIHLRQGRFQQATDHFGRTLQIARAIGHQVGELDALTGLGHIHRLQGRHAKATDQLGRALQIARAIGHRAGELEALTGLGRIHWLQGRYAKATDQLERALQIARAIGHRDGELEALLSLGHIHRSQNRYTRATDQLERALQIARAIGHRAGELNALADLGTMHRMQGRYEQAIDHFGRALQIARAIGHRAGELNALTGLGHIYRLQGRYEQAADYYRLLHDLAQTTGDRNTEFEAAQGMGRLRHATGELKAAISQHHRALRLADQLGQPLDEARAHDGLARAHDALNQPEKARSHWQSAMDILAGLGVDHTDDEETTSAAIRTHLTRLDHETRQD